MHEDEGVDTQYQNNEFCFPVHDHTNDGIVYNGRGQAVAQDVCPTCSRGAHRPHTRTGTCKHAPGNKTKSTQPVLPRRAQVDPKPEELRVPVKEEPKTEDVEEDKDFFGELRTRRAPILKREKPVRPEDDVKL